MPALYSDALTFHPKYDVKTSNPSKVHVLWSLPFLRSTRVVVEAARASRINVSTPSTT